MTTSSLIWIVAEVIVFVDRIFRILRTPQTVRRSAVTALAVVIGGGGGGGGVLVSAAAAAAVAGEVVVVSRCRFPASWKGQYFQSGLGIIIIKDSLMTTKGECVDHNRDYFLIDNRENQCFQCLLMISRHQNIIQYKESFCVAPDSLMKVCGQIHVETPLYTLVRDSSVGVVCPFHEAYYFSYNDHQSTVCSQPISYAKPCVGQTKYLLHFKHCAESAIWNGKDIDFECLATWRDGSESFLYGRLKASTVNMKDEQYRCLKFVSYGAEVYLSMSADATCRGLRSPSDGPLVMTFIKDEFGWFSVTCVFPDWLRGITWKEVEGHRMFSFDEKGSVLREFVRRKSTTAARLQSETRCTKIIATNNNSPDTETIVYSSITQGCTSKHLCIKFTKVANKVIHMQQDAVVDNLAECPSRQNDRQPTILIPEDEVVINCQQLMTSYVLYSFANRTSGCYYKMKSICANETTSTGAPSCSGRGRGEDVVLECRFIWRNNESTFLMAKRLSLPIDSERQQRCKISKEDSFESWIFVGREESTPVEATAAALLSLVFLKIQGSSGIFVNVTSNASRPLSFAFNSSSSLGESLTSELAPFSSTTWFYEKEEEEEQKGQEGKGEGDKKRRTGSRGGGGGGKFASQVPESSVRHLTDSDEFPIDEDDDEYDVSSGSQSSEDGVGRAAAEGSSDYTAITLHGEGGGGGVGGAKDDGRTDIHDSHRISPSRDTDFQFALISGNTKDNSNDNKDNSNDHDDGGDVSGRQKQQRKLYGDDGGGGGAPGGDSSRLPPRGPQEEPGGRASPMANEGTQPYHHHQSISYDDNKKKSGISHQTPDRTSGSQPRSSPNCACALQSNRRLSFERTIFLFLFLHLSRLKFHRIFL